MMYVYSSNIQILKVIVQIQSHAYKNELVANTYSSHMAGFLGEGKNACHLTRFCAQVAPELTDCRLIKRSVPCIIKAEGNVKR